MIQENIEIRTADGVADTILFRPGDGRRPAVIYLTDIGGIRPAPLDMARRLAAEGYTVLVPNVFYRTGRPPLLDFVMKPGDERTMKRFAELAAPLTPEAMERDASSYVDYFPRHDSVTSGMMAVVGYCFTGSMAVRTAAVRADKIAAAASFHGGWLFTDAPTSPHLALPRIKAELYFGHAVEDRSMPEDTVRKFNLALEAWGGRFASEIYADARHGWTVPDSAAYNEAQANRAFGKLTGLLKRNLT